MLLSRELAVAAATSNFPSSHNFFEMIRVDFVIDEDLNVFIMEVEILSKLLYINLIFDFLIGQYESEFVVSTFSSKSIALRASHSQYPETSRSYSYK